MSMSLRVIVPPHPLISHWLTVLRNPTTPEILYATGLEQLGTWLTYEALRDWIPSKKEKITTSTGTTAGTGRLLVSQDDIEDVEELRRLSTSAAGSSVFFSISGDGVRKIRGGIELRR